MRTCKRCEGAGKYHDEYAIFDSKTQAFSAGMRPCRSCDGRGTFPELNTQNIVECITTARGGKGKRRFRKSMTSPLAKDGLDAARAYYVWRLARFHGGADVTMPMMADLVIRGDAFRPELDALADLVAKHVYGTDMAAAYRWSNALGGNHTVPSGLPATAYSSGPVHDGADAFTTALLALEGKE